MYIPNSMYHSVDAYRMQLVSGLKGELGSALPSYVYVLQTLQKLRADSGSVYLETVTAATSFTHQGRPLLAAFHYVVLLIM